MTFNGAIMQLVEMRENSMMPVAFKPYFDKVIETLSEVEPAPQWIPCRLVNQYFIPELKNCKQKPYLVTYETITGRRFVTKVSIYNGRVRGKENRIIAYMPLPSPYNPESEE